MNKPYIFITRKLPDKIVEPLLDSFEVKMWPYEEKPVTREVLIKEVAQADALLSMLSDSVDKELISSAPNLKVIANLAVGFDNIDIAAAQEYNITVCHTPDVLTETTADLTFGLLMATARRLIEANRYVTEGKWENWSPLFLAGSDIYNKTIGIVGMGRIGEAVARRAFGFNMSILYHNRNRKEDTETVLGARYVSLDELLEKSDYVVCLAPSTKATKEMFNKSTFNKMKPSAIFINASRGSNVDEDALYQALVNGEIKAAGLDVFRKEPIEKNHPLLKLDNVVALPHIGSSSYDTRNAMMELCVENILLVLRDEEPKTPIK